MSPNQRETDTRQHGAAWAHGDSHPSKRRAALYNGVTARTERRWRTPPEARGAPAERFIRYARQCENRARLKAWIDAEFQRMDEEDHTRESIIDRIRAAHIEDALAEGEANATRHKRGISFLERAVIEERDKASDGDLVSLYRLAHIRGITEEEVFGFGAGREGGR